MTNDAAPTLAEVVAVLEHMYDPAWARDWDAVGLVCGDPDSLVRKVLLAVDPVAAVVDEALTRHADLVITHHPLFLRPVHAMAATSHKGRIVHRLVRANCALYTAHTNADVAAPGVSDALARILGLTDLEPLSADLADPTDKVVTSAPADAVEAVTDAMVAAGALAPPGGAQGPTAGPARVRIELVVPRTHRRDVVLAARQAHPEKDAAVDVYELAAWQGPRGVGRVGRLSAPTTLREFALLVAEALPAASQGVRIAGDPTTMVTRVAVCGGAGDSLLDAARACGADVFVTADLRHHPTSEARERAGEGPPYLVDVAHWASEWPWLAGVANRLEGAMEAAGTPIEVHVSAKSTDPWTFRVPSPGSVVR